MMNRIFAKSKMGLAEIKVLAGNRASFVDSVRPIRDDLAVWMRFV